MWFEGKNIVSFTFCSFMFQVGYSNLETVSFSNGPTLIQITNE